MMLHTPNLLQNLANIIVFIMLANRIFPYIMRWNESGKRAAIGVLFGLAGIISMQFSIQVADGITADLKAVLAGMSGLIGGPVSGAIAFLFIGISRVQIGGIGMMPSLVCLFVVAATGSLLYHFSRKRSSVPMKNWWGPVSFGCFIALCQLATAWMLPADLRSELLRDFTLPLMLLYPIATLVFHYFMTVEWSRQQEAMFDPVTQLPRMERLEDKWKRMIRKKRHFALVIVNVERLRLVNDLYGVQAGNALLRECGKLLFDLLPADGTVCRLNGHDFAVTLPAFDRFQALVWIDDMKKRLAGPYYFDNAPYEATFGTGMAVYEGGDCTWDELFLQAETALRHAMDSGLNQHVSYESRLTEQIRYRTSLEKDLRFALERGQLHLHYQPQYDLQTGELRGFEALLRWQHPDWGPISPVEFIPLAEETRLIIPIGNWVLETACDMAMRLNLNDSGSTMAVNISVVQLLEPDFPSKVAEKLRASGLNGSLLELELTESTMVKSFEKAAEQLMYLKELGVRLALDDFGVGYSSLSYLRRLPFDLIKIDRSFIEDIGRSRDDRMTQSIIDWVRNLRYGIVAEGLESYDQLYWLRLWKCDIAQGYLFSRPMPEHELLRYVEQFMPFPLSGLSSERRSIPS